MSAVRLVAELRRRIGEAPRPCQRRPEVFFPVHGGFGAKRERVFQEQVDTAKAACLSCGARIACLRLALVTREPFGVWGGLTEEERRPLLRVGSSRSSDVDGLVEAWSRQDTAPSTCRALRAALKRYLLWCREEDADPLQTGGVDLVAFARWLCDMGVPVRSRGTAVKAARSWLEFLGAGQQAGSAVAS